MARVQVASDSFTYADGTLSSVSANWADLNPFTGTAAVVSGAVNHAFASPTPTRWIGAGSWTADQYAKIAITAGFGNLAGQKSGVIVRASADVDGARDYYAAYVEEDGGGGLWTNIEKTVNGVVTSLSRVSGDGWAAGDTIELEAEGTTLRVFRNGVLLRSVTDSSIAGATTDRAGVIGQDDFFRSDNWEGGNITADASLTAGAESAYLAGGLQPQTSPLTISKW